MSREELEKAITRELAALPWWDQPEEETNLATIPDDLLIELLQDLTGTQDV